MSTLYLRLVRRLYLDHDQLSRNRNYLVFEAPEAARARRVAAHLRSVRNDLLRNAEHTPVFQREPDGRVCLTFERAAVDASRVAWLSAEEYSILREDAAVASLLDSIAPARPKRGPPAKTAAAVKAVTQRRAPKR